MKRVLTHTTALILLLFLCFSLTACATEKNAVGTWEGHWSANGSDIYVTLNICEDGTYSKTSYKNGLYNGSESGKWVVDKDEKELELHEFGEFAYTPYDYNGRTLINNGHKLKKQ